jgi:hypothetical protein
MMTTEAALMELDDRVVDGLYVENDQHLLDRVGAIVCRGVYAKLRAAGWFFAHSPFEQRVTLVASSEKKDQFQEFMMEAAVKLLKESQQ